jgi:hypothetical protein
MPNYSAKLSNLRRRRTGFDPALESYQFNEAVARNSQSYDRVRQPESIKYAIGAMQPVDDEYTANTYKEGDRVKNHLAAKLPENGIGVEFEYQGSVTNNTHVKAHSDIDLLTIHAAFFTLEPPQTPAYPYRGDPVQDLVQLRQVSARIIKSAFPQVEVDESGSKSLTLSGGSLKRKIDVVPANWFDTNAYARTRQRHQRGIMILDYKTKERPQNLPFLHNHRIDAFDGQMNGNMRKATRLLKNLKYDADRTVNVSSYDIAALTYNMPNYLLDVPAWHELRLVSNCASFLLSVIADSSLRERLVVPDGSRKVFGTPGATLEGITALYMEVYELEEAITQELQYTRSTLPEAVVVY